MATYTTGSQGTPASNPKIVRTLRAERPASGTGTGPVRPTAGQLFPRGKG
jgi:hypothetical protein